ncbi:beta-lactamase/transpeptidase-like protein [Daedaleopsis nitida]|nr:beta-lactamase/transpeptidase-like protein [Daedaleopsis nitida]
MLIAGLVTASAVFSSATQVPLKVQDPRELLSASFDSFIDEIRRNGSIPGVAVGVVRLGEDNEPYVQLGAWGRRTEDGDGHDLTPDTLFGIASCSKAFLATSLGMLMDDFAHGRNKTALPETVKHFNYDTKIVDLMPAELGWALQSLPDGDDWATRKVTVRDVLGHLSGLPGNDYAYARGDTAEDIVRRMSSLRTAYELREKWSYNNQMYMLGAYLASHYAGMPYHEYATERIFVPLKMASTTFLPSVAQRSGKLTDAWTKAGRRIPYWFDDEMVSITAGPGGIISSPEDMVKWLAVWLNKGVDPVFNATIFPRSVYDAVTTAQKIISDRPEAPMVGYGMGWLRWNYGAIDLVAHGGGVPGFSLYTTFSPNNNIGVFIASNADEKGLYNVAILKNILDTVLGPQKIVADTQSVQKPADPQPPSLGLRDYVGTYTAPGYNDISICAVTSGSEYCSAVLIDFSPFEPPSAANSSLYSAFDSLWATHVRLSHVSGDVFNVTFTALFPHGYGRDTSAFETYETGTSEGWAKFFVADGRVEGFGLVLDDDAYAARVRRASVGATVRETADVWFERT